MSLKTIKVNPIFLGTSTAKNKTRKEKPAGVSMGQSNNIKKKLIARIKNFQQNSQKQTNVMSVETPLNDAFGDSVQFLDNLARDKEEQKRDKKNNTLKKKQAPDAYMHIATELPPELDWNVIAPQTPMQAPIQAPMQAPIQMQVPIQMQAPMQVQVPMQIQAPIQPTPWQSHQEPSYSNLKKGGTKPTYRTWLRNTQKQRPLPEKTHINILEDISLPEKPMNPLNQAPLNQAPLNQDPLNQDPLSIDTYPGEVPINNTTPSYIPSAKPRRKRITKTLKYKLGKHANGKVSVLIKNSQTRRKVQTEQALLKQKSILDIKNHLRKNNLLKVGSNAPNDVLRHLYEQSILAGQIENKAKETLIHNYFNDEKK